MRAKARVYRQSPFTGRGYFAGEGDGIVTVGLMPARRRIFCFDEQTMRCVRDVYSNAEDGTYRIDNLDETRTYMLVGYDNHGKFHPEAWSGMLPRKME